MATKNPRICLTNIPDAIYNLITDKKAEMIKEKKRHVSNELTIFTLLKEKIK